jgi:hypothetical protein
VVTEDRARLWAAYHAAGHAVVALWLGEEIDYIEMQAFGAGFQRPA